MGWLDSSDNEDVKKLGQSIEQDRTEFAGIIKQEIATIQSASNGQLDFGMVIFTNQMATQGTYAFRLPGKQAFETGQLSLTPSNDFVYASHPLAHPESMKKVLSAVADRFSPADHEFVLITKSHGTFDRPLIPRLGIDAEHTTRQQLLTRLLAKVDQNSPAKQEPVDLTEKAGEHLGTGGDGNLRTGKGKLLIGNRGTSKDRYVRTLCELQAESGMQFKLVFMESCQSQLSEAQANLLQSAVGTLYTSDTDGLKYQTLNYEQLLDSVQSGHSLTDAMKAQLTK